MSNKVIINKQEVQFGTQNNQIFCTSLDVAKVFGKRHDHVLRDIENILNDLREIGTSQDLLNFGEVVRISKTTNPKNGKLVNRKMPMYNLTRDGFSLLAMGFTGKKALQFKIAFIKAFNEMEKLLQKEIKSPNKYLTDLMELIYPNLPQNDYKVSVIITDNPYSKEAKNVFSLKLEIFELCERLSELLGDKEAIADLKKLYTNHPEMFKDMQEVKEVINKVVSEPEIIVDANRDKRNYEIIKAAKIINDKKMADVVIKNESGTNEIFHANKKRIKEFNRLNNKDNLLQVETPTLSTHQLNGLELMDKNPSGANALSATINQTIPQKDKSANDFKAKLEEFSTKKTNAIKSINKEFKR